MALLRKLLRMLETVDVPGLRSAGSHCGNPEVAIDASVSRLIGFLDRTAERLQDTQRKRFYKAMTLRIAKELKGRGKSYLLLLKALAHVLGLQTQSDEPADVTLRVEAVMQGLLSRMDGEIGYPPLSAELAAQSAVRDFTIEQMVEEMPEMNLITAEVVTMLGDGELPEDSDTDETKDAPDIETQRLPDAD